MDQAAFAPLPMLFTKGVGSTDQEVAVGEETGGVAVVITVTAPPILLLAVAATAAISNTHDNNYSSHNSKNGIIPNARSATSITPAAQGPASISMMRITKKRRPNIVTNSHGIDTNWYADSGATEHITGELDKLTMRERYHGGDQVHTASGTGMELAQIGNSIVKTPKKNLHLNNVLHVPHASKNLVSVHCYQGFGNEESHS